MALITAAQVISAMPIHQGIDQQMITPYISITEQQELEGCLSKEFYAELLTYIDGNGDITATGDLLTFMRDYLRPMLACAIAERAVTTTGVQLGTSGANRFSDANGQNANNRGEIKLQSRFRSMKNQHKIRMFDWLNDNDSGSQFATYRANNKTDWQKEVFRSSTNIL